MKLFHTSRREQFPRKLMLTALICELVLTGIYWFDIATGNHFQMLHSLFDLDSEGNIPAWFSSSQLFCVAIAFWSCAFRQKRANRPSKLFFALAGLGAIYASSDETAQIHERVTAFMGQRYVDWLPAYAAHNFLFVMLAVAFLLTICQLLADDLITLWKNHRSATVLAVAGVATALAGGMGIETVGYKLFAGDTSSIWYKVEVTVEEFMEMLGGTLILVSALKLRLHRGTAAERTAKITKLQLASANHNPLP